MAKTPSIAIRASVFLVVVILTATSWANDVIRFNGKPLDPRERQMLAPIVGSVDAIPPGDYWYDAATGATGRFGGPVLAIIAPGLNLGGALQANASGGGYGQLTGVFINGRELHPYDVARLQSLGPVYRGRYLWDAAGNVALQNGTFLFNFYQLVQQRGGKNPYYRSDISNGSSVFVGQGCASVSGRLSPTESSSSYDYYVGCE